MKKILYEVREYTESNCFYSQTWYGIFDVKAVYTAWTTNPLNGLMLKFNNKDYAEIVCTIMNLDDQD